MHKHRTSIVTLSLGLLSATGMAFAADPAPTDAAAAKPVLPSVSDLLDASGLTATGYVSGTYSFQSYSASGVAAPKDTDAFILQQAAFTLSKLPTAGFGALVNVIAGQNIYTPNYGVAGASSTSTQFQLAQGYLQYIDGPVTVIAGKFVTLAGAEVLASVGNTNVTRSLLYSFEPVTHTGARLTYAVNDQVNLIIGANNGWIYSNETGTTNPFGKINSGKTVEFGAAWTPSKAFNVTAQGYFGEDVTFAGTTAHHTLLDSVATWTVNSALSLVGSVDWGSVDHSAFGPGLGNANWYGIAGYVNYALNDLWRVSGRGEYFDDRKGYLTGVGTGIASTTTGQKLYEGTVDLGYDPVKNVELRLEGRYDSYEVNSIKVIQGWLEALYKF